MKLSNPTVAFTAASLLAFTGNAEPIRRTTYAKRELPLVEDKALVDAILLDDLLGCAQDLEDIAYSTAGRNRVHGTEGHLKTVQYFSDQLSALGDYYDIKLQDFTTEVTLATHAELSVGGKTLEAGGFSFGKNGTWTDVPLVTVANLGCNAVDHPETLTGAIALIARGDCTFVQKITLAGQKGAVGAIIYNNADVGIAAGTLGGVNDLIPVGGISRADGLRLVSQIANGTTVTSSGDFWQYIANLTSHNVIASSKSGDASNVLFLGAHSDSVDAGPGINDNGSGSCGILTVAKALAKYTTDNQVRFAWWTAEEEGLLGAEHYVRVAAPADLDKIRLYLNFDMIASPNYVLGIYDGDGSAFNLSGPAGSAEVEKLFEDWYTAQELPFVPSEFNGRSDYGPFLDAGVPSGGLDTGADGTKTEEEVTLFGGTAGIWYDPNYHSAADNVTNLNLVAFEATSKAIAHAVATYGTSWEGFPTRNVTSLTRRTGGYSKKYNAPTKKSRRGKKTY
ncbi:Zn-dependent exopeptidase [Annulohypoxylon maeteangense]|uniref:Zn-dependent exopeptidase n=1 Tax=Annulohypoxylon maeteangense TaxID=1927788 RepID=UPI002008C557|nr:Zn-dependent exopeptidase [Annulohypoxylon maeteangense]KAI0885462.1 Zn-dependent exopeptidase [Annulohypoxylon maeteangense]